jgi:hypothetical protein|nr:MAG TPA: hypothetical protein [Caudoviricetes sp.]
MATNNINLEEIEQSNTFGQWLDAFNANMGAIDALPIPMEYGKNTKMEYLKFTNGKVAIWGRIDFGTTYICDQPWAEGFGSKNFTIDFPIALTKSNPMVIPHVMTGSGVYPDMFCVTRSTSYTTYTGAFVTSYSDALVKTPKILNILIIGDWK